MAIIAATVDRIKSDPLECLGGRQRVNELFARAGHVWRKCFWDPATTLGMFIVQVLHGNAAISELRHLTGVDVNDSTYCDARLRLPAGAVAQVVQSMCGECCKSNESSRTWLGHRVLIADATSASTPDEPVLQDLWPQPSAQKQGCGFPIIKLLGMLDLVSGMYNLIRAAMVLAGDHQGVDPNRISFTDAQRRLCSIFHKPAVQVPLQLIVNCIRQGRWAPRVLKRRIKEFDLMTQPRAHYAEPSPVEEFTA